MSNSLRQTRRKVDANQPEIVDALRQVGCTVQSLAMVGRGVPDLLVARNGRMWLMEIKNGANPPSKQRLTDDEQAWIDGWAAPVYVVNSVERALEVVAYE